MKKYNITDILANFGKLSDKQYMTARDAGYSADELTKVNYKWYADHHDLIRWGGKSAEALPKQIEYLSTVGELDPTRTYLYSECRFAIRQIAKSENHDQRYIRCIQAVEADNANRKNRKRGSNQMVVVQKSEPDIEDEPIELEECSASNYLRASTSVSAPQYVNLRRYGYLPSEIENISQDDYTAIKQCLESDGLSTWNKPMTDLQERTLDLYSIEIDAAYTDDQARQIISNFLLAHPEEDARFVQSFAVWLKKYKSKGTMYNLGIENNSSAKVPVPMPKYRSSIAPIIEPEPEEVVIEDDEPVFEIEECSSSTTTTSDDDFWKVEKVEDTEEEVKETPEQRLERHRLAWEEIQRIAGVLPND